jgi:hypothetical protein
MESELLQSLIHEETKQYDYRDGLLGNAAIRTDVTDIIC